MQHQLRSALVILAVFTVITGIIYPLLVTGIAQLVFNNQANGSFIIKDSKNYGSYLIGQQFSNPKYFWGRPSATAPSPYNASASSGSNYGPLNPALRDGIEARIEALRSYDPDNTLPIPVDLVTYSGSGLDPHISLAAAMYQSHRVAKYRGTPEEKILPLIRGATEGRQLGILGEPRVNVLLLNLALDNIL
ncbi:MAG: potassium-transporting ATPase subunit KdpC [Chloroflexi bacterium]|nr:potassium-transporting ATPase subunit KdpC [Chloroflexota bacterium]